MKYTRENAIKMRDKIILQHKQYIGKHGMCENLGGIVGDIDGLTKYIQNVPEMSYAERGEFMNNLHDVLDNLTFEDAV